MCHNFWSIRHMTFVVSAVLSLSVAGISAYMLITNNKISIMSDNSVNIVSNELWVSLLSSVVGLWVGGIVGKKVYSNQPQTTELKEVVEEPEPTENEV